MQARLEQRRCADQGSWHDPRQSGHASAYLADRSYKTLNRAVRSEVLGDSETALTVVIAGIFHEAWLLEIEAVAVS